MTIQLVETSEDSIFMLVAQHVSELLAVEGEPKTALTDNASSVLVAECTSLLQDENFEGYVSKLISHLEQVFEKCSDKECETITTILVHAVARVPDAATVACSQALAAALASKVDDRADERLGALLNLYGVTARPEVQLPVLLCAARFAARSPKLAAKLTGVVTAAGVNTEAWVAQWGLSDSQARELFLALAELVKASEKRGGDREHLRLIINALKLVPEGDAAGMAQLKPYAAAAVADYTRNPLLFQSDLGELSAVRQLAGDAAHAPAYKLMTAMLGGDLAAYRAAATPAALQAVEMSESDALQKARMAALLSLGTTAGTGEIAFGDIQKALDIPEDQVELVVVKAIGSKLLEGKIDQIRGVVSITRCSMRTFGAAEWAHVRGRLASWREALVAVQHNLATNKAGAASAGVPSRGQQAIHV